MAINRSTPSRILPEQIKSPIQLLAVWFVTLIAINGSFLSAAALSLPIWMKGALIVAAISNVPIFIGCLFLLQTLFREKMLSDELYAKVLMQGRRESNELAKKLQSRMDKANVGMVALAQGKSLDSDTMREVRPMVEQLRAALAPLEKAKESSATVDPDSMRALAEGELALGHWANAARLLTEYASFRPDDFETNYSRGVAFANAKDGRDTDVQALRAYNEAIVTIPEGSPPDLRARLFTYRGAMLKRLARYKEALADFQLAGELASHDYERNDLLYNLASTYGLMGDRAHMMEVVKGLDARSPVRAWIKARLGDYFLGFAEDAEFIRQLPES